MIMAKVLAVNISAEKGVPKQPLEQGYFEVNCGLRGDAHAGDWHRQVSLLGIESFIKMQLAGAEPLPMGSFAENITTEGITLFELPIGTRLQVGEALMEVTQIGKECHTGCAIRQTVGDCVMPREGIFTRIITPGNVKPGDSIEIVG
jgi:MOSC domain-containing protein YiiM